MSLHLDEPTKAADTIISIGPEALAFCPNCDWRATAYGPDRRGVLGAAAWEHDQECADLAEAAAVMRQYGGGR